jgi:hypothetical protein
MSLTFTGVFNISNEDQAKLSAKRVQHEANIAWSNKSNIIYSQTAPLVIQDSFFLR